MANWNLRVHALEVIEGIYISLASLRDQEKASG